jgi:hypothetical protein
MADIARYPFLRHLRGTNTTHVQQVRNGKTIHSGIGAAFWFRPLSAVLSEVPVNDRELPLLFHARTSDFQDVTVQATVTYRLTDPDTASGRIDFSIDPETGLWRGTPLDQVAGLLTETAQQYALDLLACADLTTALAGGVGPVRQVIADGLAGDPRLAETGIAVVGVRVVAVRPEPEVEKALRTPTREQVPCRVAWSMPAPGAEGRPRPQNRRRSASETCRRGAGSCWASGRGWSWYTARWARCGRAPAACRTARSPRTTSPPSPSPASPSWQKALWSCPTAPQRAC